MTELDFDLDESQESPAEKRIKSLSDKVRLTSEERDELAKAKETLQQENSSISKERDFYKDFSNITAKYQGANEYQEKILEKVKSGYTVEDAAVSILHTEGKLSGTPTPPEQKESPAGGSAVNALSNGEKSFSEMTRDERRQALVKAEAESGELSAILRQ